MDVYSRSRREADLVAYYNGEVKERAQRDLPVQRIARRGDYLGLLEREGRRSVLEIGSGPGRDGVAFAAAGHVYTGVDLTPASVAACRAEGLAACVASVLKLPFAAGSFDAGWTMSTLLHIADDDLDAALAEVVRVLRPGAPLAVGTWGDRTGGESVWRGPTGADPPRFVSIRTDDALRAVLARHGVIEQWTTWPGPDGMHYQWALLRTPGGP
jgi:SAM-dependent methyltransferase